MTKADTTEVHTGYAAITIESYILQNRKNVVSGFAWFLSFGFVSIALISVFVVSMLPGSESWLIICGAFATWTMCLAVISGIGLMQDFLNLLAS